MFQAILEIALKCDQTHTNKMINVTMKTFSGKYSLYSKIYSLYII